MATDLVTERSETHVKQVVMLPCSLEAATTRMMRRGSIAREVFGDEFVEHYGSTREHEVYLWNQAVTNWEGKGNGLRDTDFSDYSLVERYLELA